MHPLSEASRPLEVQGLGAWGLGFRGLRFRVWGVGVPKGAILAHAHCMAGDLPHIDALDPALPCA